MNIISKCIVFISSYFPLYIFLLILNFESFNTIEKIKRFPILLFLGVIVVCILISILSLIGIYKSPKGTKKLLITVIDRPEDTVLSYIMTYIIPVLIVNNMGIYQIIVNILLFILIGYLYIKLNLLYLNPLWSVFGFISYRVNDDIVLITNYKMIELKNKMKNKQKIDGYYMANNIFIAKRERNR